MTHATRALGPRYELRDPRLLARFRYRRVVSWRELRARGIRIQQMLQHGWIREVPPDHIDPAAPDHPASPERQTSAPEAEPTSAAPRPPRGRRS